MRRILVLGASGFLGRALVGPLLAAGWDVSAVVRSNEAAARLREESAAITTLGTDQVDGKAYEAVINLIVDYGRGVTALAPLIRTNLLTPLDIIERVQTAAVINVSSALPAEYSHYSLSKKMLEAALERLGRQGKFGTINVMLHNMYGPGSDETNLVTALIVCMVRGERIDLAGGVNARDFIHVDDTVDALVTLADAHADVPAATPVHVGTGKATSIRTLAGMVATRLGTNGDIRFGVRPDNPSEPPVLKADPRAMTALGWRPRWSLEHGLDATIASLT